MFKTDLDLHNTYSLDSKMIDQPGRVSSQRYLTAAVWTVDFGYDNNARPSLDRLASVLDDTNADVIDLLERDTAKTFFRNNDLTSYLGER
ncbi:unnamed protein product [Rotaria sordida]|uniref:PGAP2IP C-terminal nuclease-like domain-containing protein n=1 Tax=Rotaria sordida TaxID=392033 RepID=A0A820G2A9_9BILA|nr:unnamed protein product [Rotaria sordida]